MIWFASLRSEYEKVMPTCSSFTTILTENELLGLAKSWKPIKNGFTCLCISNRKMVTEDLLRDNNLPVDLCENISTESRSLMILKAIESFSLAMVSIVFDFFFECKNFFNIFFRFRIF